MFKGFREGLRGSGEEPFLSLMLVAGESDAVRNRLLEILRQDRGDSEPAKSLARAMASRTSAGGVTAMCCARSAAPSGTGMGAGSATYAGQEGSGCARK